jgi:ribosomal protein S27E
MSPVPLHVPRPVRCPTCGTESSTSAHPNTLLRCRACGARYLAPGLDGTGSAAALKAYDDGAGELETPAPVPSPPAPAPGTATGAGGGGDFETVVGPVEFPPADPPPVAEIIPPPPEPPAGTSHQPGPEQSRARARWRR